jgi:hypothetical protein
MKNSNDTIGNRTRDLPACSAVPQPTAQPRNLKLLYRNLGDAPRTAQPSAKDEKKSVDYQTRSDGGRHRSALVLP